MKVCITYAEFGIVVTSFNYDKEFKDFIEKYCECKEKGYDTLREWYCTDLGIAMIRIMIVRNLIPFDEVVFRFEDKEMHPDEDARFHNWPVGFCDKMDEILGELMIGNKRRIANEVK
jgi:hypothetical protein